MPGCIFNVEVNLWSNWRNLNDYIQHSIAYDFTEKAIEFLLNYEAH